MTVLFLYLAEGRRASFPSGLIRTGCLGLVDSAFAPSSWPLKFHLHIHLTPHPYSSRSALFLPFHRIPLTSPPYSSHSTSLFLSLHLHIPLNPHPYSYGGITIRVQCLTYDVIAWWERCGQMQEATKLCGLKYFSIREGCDQMFLGVVNKF